MRSRRLKLERRLGRGPRAGWLSACAWLVLAVLGQASLVGCDESGPRVYTARLYRTDLASGACLDAYAPLGLVETDELGSTCPAVCLFDRDALYVSRVCAPYPSTATLVPAEDPLGTGEGGAPSAAADLSAQCRAALALIDQDPCE